MEEAGILDVHDHDHGCLGAALTFAAAVRIPNAVAIIVMKRLPIIAFVVAVIVIIGFCYRLCCLCVGIEVATRSEEHKSELQSLMSIPYAVYFLNKKTHINH